ncbi:hypothetical protein QWI29_20280 [Mycolicibacterium neoaurum]|uniref:hypothetical protein n=1 Tax=Mycolicibacterium neoaurum TaxID=1795 RepID=UPI002672F7C2|nr:hypothetical protein [Mycolicibacterium neoaurum]MDO3402386.1 hypothetical protein [Mycolicibacterium neoaurum]
MTIDGLVPIEDLPSGAQGAAAPDIQPWVDLRAPDPHTAVVRGAVRIVGQGAQPLRFEPQRCTTAKDGVVTVDTQTGQFAYTPSVAARQVSLTSTHYGDTVDTFTLYVPDHCGGRAEAHIVVEILPADTAFGGVTRETPAQPSGGVKTSTLVGGAKEVQWYPITIDSGCTLRVLSTSGGTSSLTAGGNGDHTLKFTSSGGSYLSKGPAGSVVLRVTDTYGCYTDRTYTY